MTPGRTAQLVTALFASQAEAQAGTLATKLMSPARVSQLITALFASQAEAQAGSLTTKLMNPLRVKEAITALAPAATPAKIKAGSITRAMTTASGDQAYAGVGFQPVLVLFFCHGTQPSIGVSAVAGAGACIYYDSVTPGTIMSAANAIRSCGTGVNRQDGFVKTFDADGFTITWAKNGSPTGTNTIYYLAVG
jgi:hypothetical protein